MEFTENIYWHVEIYVCNVILQSDRAQRSLGKKFLSYMGHDPIIVKGSICNTWIFLTLFNVKKNKIFPHITILKDNFVDNFCQKIALHLPQTPTNIPQI